MNGSEHFYSKVDAIYELPDLSLAERSVLVRIARYPVCFLTVKSIASKSKVSRSKTHKSLKKLVDIGLVDRQISSDWPNPAYSVIWINIPEYTEDSPLRTLSSPLRTHDSLLRTHDSLLRTQDSLLRGHSPYIEEDLIEDLVEGNAAKQKPKPRKLDPNLLEYINHWNQLPKSIEAPRIRMTDGRPSPTLVNAWKRRNKDPTLKESTSDIPALMAAIEQSKGLHKQSWFNARFPFTASKTGECRAERILEGFYNQEFDDNRRSFNGQNPARVVAPPGKYDRFE